MKKKFNGLLALFAVLALIFAGCSDSDSGSSSSSGTTTSAKDQAVSEAAGSITDYDNFPSTATPLAVGDIISTSTVYTFLVTDEDNVTGYVYDGGSGLVLYDKTADENTIANGTKYQWKPALVDGCTYTFTLQNVSTSNYISSMPNNKSSYNMATTTETNTEYPIAQIQMWEYDGNYYMILANKAAGQRYNNYSNSESVTIEGSGPYNNYVGDTDTASWNVYWYFNDQGTQMRWWGRPDQQLFTNSNALMVTPAAVVSTPSASE